VPAGRSSLRTIGMLGLLLTLATFGGWFLWPRLADPKILPLVDYSQYWSAGQANLHGQNPYDAEILNQIQRPFRPEDPEPVMMWNPPWTLTFIMPFGAMPARLSQFLWLTLSLLTVLLSVDVLWRLYGGATEQRAIAWLLGIIFVPTLLLLQFGQIGFLILLGLTAFLYLEDRGYPFLAGICTILVGIKPHLTYLFWPILLVTSLTHPNGRRILLGAVFGLLLATAIPVFFNPDVLQQYREALSQRPPNQWKSSTLGAFLRLFFTQAGERFGLQLLPLLLGFGWMMLYFLKEKMTLGNTRNWKDRLPLILLISFVTAPYGAWPYDLVILFPAVIQIATQLPLKLRLFALILFVGINLLALACTFCKISLEYYAWMAPSLLLLYLLLRARMARSQ
jgi:hypothetical protein